MSNLTFTLGLTNSGFLSGIRASQTAMNAFAGVARGVAGSAASAFRGITGAIRGGITVMHELNGAAQGVQGAFDVLLGPVKMAAQIESARVKFRVLIGDVEKADAIFGKLGKLADDNAVLDLKDVADAASQLAATDIDKAGIPEFLRQLGEASDDAEKFGRMVTASVQVLAKGGKVQTGELLQFAEAGLPVMTEMARVLKVNGEEFAKMTEQGVVGFDTLSQAIANLTTGTGRYAGKAAAAADTTIGKWNNITIAIDKAKRAFGEQVMIGLQPALEAGLNLAQKLAPEAAAAGEKVKEMVLFVTAAFKSNQLGPMISEGLQLAGYQFIDLMTKGVLAIAKNMREELADLATEAADRMIIANPIRSVWGKKGRDEAVDRQIKRDSGFSDAGKSLGDHFKSASSGLEDEISKLQESLKTRKEAVQPFAELLQHNIKGAMDTAGTRYDSKGETAPAVKAEAKPLAPAEWQGPLQEEAPLLPAPGEGGSAGNGGGGRMTGGGTGHGGRLGYNGADGGDAGGGQDGEGAREAPKANRRAITLAKQFQRQGKGSGAKSWNQWLDSGVRTSGLSGGQLAAMRKMDPAQLAGQVTNRTGRTAAAAASRDAAQKDAKSASAVDAVVKALPTISTDLEAIKNHLSKIQSR